MSSHLYNIPKSLLFLCLRRQGHGVEADLAMAQRWVGAEGPQDPLDPLSSYSHQKSHSGFGGTLRNSDKALAPSPWVGEEYCPVARVSSTSHCPGGGHSGLPPASLSPSHCSLAYSGNSSGHRGWCEGALDFEQRRRAKEGR